MERLTEQGVTYKNLDFMKDGIEDKPNKTTKPSHETQATLFSIVTRSERVISCTTTKQ